MKLRGTITAMVTPFINGELDEEGFASNVNYQIEQGVSGILPLGTTGEASTLSPSEQGRIINIAVEKAQGRVPVWIGTGSYCTRQTIEKTKRAKDLGADIALIVTPYYNRPTQEGIFRHFEAITAAIEIPIVIYNNPGRCSTNIEAVTLRRIAELPNIIGVKESPENINHAGDVIYTIAQNHPNFSVLSGDDALTLPMMALGAVGVVSVVSNLMPARIVALVEAIERGDYEMARTLHYQLLPFYKAAFIETNPIPIKTAMQLCGMPSGECRLPLSVMAPENVEILRSLVHCKV